MFHLLLLSGAAFVAAGAVLAAQARIVVFGNAIPRRALALLAAFAVARGLTQWVEMAALVDGSARGGDPTIALVHVALLAASFTLLFAFALALLEPEARRGSRVPAIAVAAVAAWAVSLAVALGSAHVADRTVSPGTAVVLTRWLLELPANVCGAIALLGVARSIELEQWEGARLVRAAAVAFLVHGLSDALELLLPALDATGHLGARLPLVAVGTGTSAAIAFFLSEVLVFQTGQRLRRQETHLRDDLIALVTHELGNPVAAIELAVERLAPGRGPAIEARVLEDVKACTVTLRRIVSDLLDTSRIQARQLPIAPRAMELGPVLERAAAVASAHDPGRPPVALARPGDLPAVLADPARVDQILGNLLTNASKYASPGSPVVVEAEPGSGGVTVRVVNEGQGIEPAEAARIFSRSYRAQAASRGSVRGLGLGLYVARALVEAQGGRIWVDSGGARTAFCFTLPLAGRVKAPAPAAGRESQLAT